MYIVANASGLAAPITATTGGIFNAIAGEPGAGAQLALNIPGTNRLNAQSFRVRGAGFVTLPAGTYTASVQPLLYASTTAGFTAAAASAIYSAAAINVTVASATASKSFPFAVEALLSGDSTSGLLASTITGIVNNGAQQGATAPVAAVNVPTAINFATEPPLQFAFGVTLGSGAVAGSVVNLPSFLIEA